MSSGKKQAKQAEQQALFAAHQSALQTADLQNRLAREKERAQRLFIRQLRARQGGGFFEAAGTGSQLGSNATLG